MSFEPFDRDFAAEYENARALFEAEQYAEAATLFAELVDRSALEPPLHGTNELRLYLARSYYHSAQLSRAEEILRALLVDHQDDHYALLLLGRTLQRQSRHEEAKPHLAMAKLLGGYDIEGPDLPED
ncbi:tetratricopeptide repeat protein [Knoellia remsis]|uniref:Tetratricopeptide repeat protein n=1 Tax=Knoellia remsis TaxID=407159 RepID=A0A2T0U856_9MICO|nr:tetratricopeptide repeat protein [Knoellia remsis]PRY54038.1 tetratricopeptide repeat protein [Knoellia remsis]